MLTAYRRFSRLPPSTNHTKLTEIVSFEMRGKAVILGLKPGHVGWRRVHSVYFPNNNNNDSNNNNNNIINNNINNDIHEKITHF